VLDEYLFRRVPGHNQIPRNRPVPDGLHMPAALRARLQLSPDTAEDPGKPPVMPVSGVTASAVLIESPAGPVPVEPVQLLNSLRMTRPAGRQHKPRMTVTLQQDLSDPAGEVPERVHVQLVTHRRPDRPPWVTALRVAARLRRCLPGYSLRQAGHLAGQARGFRQRLGLPGNRGLGRLDAAGELTDPLPQLRQPRR
jgi:hypothetical protein